MKKLWNKLFKNEPQFSYVMADYQPVKINALTTEVKITEYEESKHLSADEIGIDEVHQRS